MLLHTINFRKREVSCISNYVHLTISRLVLLRKTNKSFILDIGKIHYFLSPNQMVRDIWVFIVPPHR